MKHRSFIDAWGEKAMQDFADWLVKQPFKKYKNEDNTPEYPWRKFSQEFPLDETQ